MTKINSEAVRIAVSQLGGTKAFCQLMRKHGIPVTPQTVWQWSRLNRIPFRYRGTLEAVIRIYRPRLTDPEELRQCVQQYAPRIKKQPHDFSDNEFYQWMKLFCVKNNARTGPLTFIANYVNKEFCKPWDLKEISYPNIHTWLIRGVVPKHIRPIFTELGCPERAFDYRNTHTSETPSQTKVELNLEDLLG